MYMRVAHETQELVVPRSILMRLAPAFYCADRTYPTTGPDTLPPLLNRFEVKRGEVVRCRSMSDLLLHGIG